MKESEVEADVFIKTYYPTLEEFSRMGEFLKYIENDSGENGLCKVNIHFWTIKSVVLNPIGLPTVESQSTKNWLFLSLLPFSFFSQCLLFYHCQDTNKRTRILARAHFFFCSFHVGSFLCALVLINNHHWLQIHFTFV